MSNALSRLSAILANPRRTIVEVVQVHSNGTTTVRHADGSETTVLGSDVATGYAYLESDKIAGQAPDLPYYEIEI